MATDKRARQKAARQARLAAEARRTKQRKLLRRGSIIALVAAALGGTIYLITGRHSTPATTATATTTPPVAPLKHLGSPTTTPGSTAPPTTTTPPTGSNAAAQAAANAKAVAAGCPASPATTVNHLTFPSAPPLTVDPAKTYTATVDTTAGNFVITLDAKQAPQTVNNFVFLAQKGYYHCVIFHRVIPGFMDQTGDPTGTGTGGPGYTIPDENPPAAANPHDQYPVGSVAMANTGAPHSGGSQFFIVTGAEGQSLPNSYALFGNVTSGLNVVQAINAEGSSQGVPPDVTQRILSVTIQSA